MGRRKQKTRPSEQLFAPEQKDLFEKSYEEKLQAEKRKPVECLGMAFPNDKARRKFFLEKLREKLKDPEFRKMDEGADAVFSLFLNLQCQTKI